MKKISIAITCGDINSIGPEIAIKAINYFSKTKNLRFIFIIPENVYAHYFHILKCQINFHKTKQISEIDNSSHYLFTLENPDINFGKPTKISGEIAYKAIELSYELYKNQLIDGVVTAPISKDALNLAGIKFPGHTEIYASFENSNNYTMTFLSKKFNAALSTIHIPLKNVPKELTKQKLNTTINNVIYTIQKYFGIKTPKVAILGLNPHAGENGLFGREELDLIIPVMESNPNKNFLYGPFVPDAFFAKKLYQKYNFVIGHYHDQVLIPFKLLNFDKGVNFTAGLKILRTSPDHGTAFDIANQNIANPNSFIEAIKYLLCFIKNRYL